jgi:hypothetical protein
MRRTREYTNRILDMVKDDVLDSYEALQQCLMWMSEHEVEAMYKSSFAEYEDQEEFETEDEG